MSIKIDEPKFIPMRCPVCKGIGKVNWGKQICHACGGTGVVVVDQETGRLVGDKNENENNQN